jgi:hypothetical protein
MGNNVFQSPFNVTSAAIVAALGYTPLNKAGDAMSGALTVAQGTITANAPGLNLTATWNNAGTAFQGIRLNVIDTAKAAASSLMTLTTSSGGLFDVSPTGGLTLGGSVFIGFSGRGYMRASADGVFLLRNSAETDVDRLQFGGTSSAFPALKKYATGLQVRLADDSNDADLSARRFTADANYGFAFGSRGSLAAAADGNMRLANNAGTDFGLLQFGGTTSSFPAIKKYVGAGIFQFRKADDSDWTDVELGYVRFSAKTVAGLGAAGGAGSGVVRYVTDATATTSRSVVAGGGSNKVMVWSDGTNWLIF